MAYYSVPLTNTPNVFQSFKVTLGERNVFIRLRTWYLDLFDLWMADIYDNSTGQLLISALPLVCGVNVLEPFSYMDIGEAYVVPVTETALEHPDNKSLGSVFKLLWGDGSE